MKKFFKSKSPLLIIAALAVALGIVSLSIWLGIQIGKQDTPKISSTTPNVLQPTPNNSTNDFNLKPQPSGTITPLDDSARVLVQADLLMQNGQYIEASAQYSLILKLYPTGKEAPAAQIGLGRSEMAQSHYPEAIAAYQKFIATYSNNSRTAECYFLLAEAQRSAGQLEPAIASYQKFAIEGGATAKTVEGYIYYSIAEAYLAGGKRTEAADYYKKTADLQEGSSDLVRAFALEQLGDFYAAQNKPDEAVAAYNRILAFAKVSSYRAGIALKIATAYDKAKQTDKATAAYRAVVDQYFGETAAGKALQTLIDTNAPDIDDYLKGYNAYRKGDYNNAMTILDKYLNRPGPGQPVPPIPADMPAPQQEKLARAWLWQAISVEQLKNTDRAIAEYRELANRLPNTKWGEDSQWRLAELLRQQNKPAEAIAEYAALVKKYPNGQNLEEALYYQFLLTLNTSPEQAAPLADILFARNSSRGREAMFRMAETYDAKGNKDLARTLYQKVVDTKADDYFSIRATQIRAGVAALPTPRSTATQNPAVYDSRRFATDFERDKKELETWLPTWVSNTDTTTTPKPAPTLDAAQKTVRDDAGVKRIIELMRLGRETQATREAMEAVKEFEGKPLELYWLSLVLNENRQYYYSIEAAKSLFAEYKKLNPKAGLLTTPLLLQKLIYPLNYQDLILAQATKYDVDPLLVTALIKQESAFDPNATSSADAFGLMQVIPSTGKGIATSLGKRDFVPEDLYRPTIAIEFGTYYLDQQVESFKGNPYAALAAYNAGGGNVGEWLQSNPPEKDFDLFVDGITYGETRLYVRIVYTNYAMYRQIYQNK